MLVVAAVAQHRPCDAGQLGSECHDNDVWVSAGEHLAYRTPAVGAALPEGGERLT